MIAPDVKNLRLATVGAACALGMVACFLVGVVLMASSGVQVLIPEPGVDTRGLDRRRRLRRKRLPRRRVAHDRGRVPRDHRARRVLRRASSRRAVLVLGPVLGAIGLTLVTISHLVPIAMATELVPDYLAADAAGKASLLSRPRPARGGQQRPEHRGQRAQLGRRRAALRLRDPPDGRVRSLDRLARRSSSACARAGSGSSPTPGERSRRSASSGSSGSSSSWRAWASHCFAARARTSRRP